jgi:hypothetical protein
MTALGLPFGSFIGMGMLGPEIVIAMGPEREEWIITFLHGWKAREGASCMGCPPSLDKEIDAQVHSLLLV